MIDDLDHRLIAILRMDSRTPVSTLARELGVNRSTVHTRIDRLVESGVIEGFTLRLSNDIDRDAIRAVTMIATDPKYGRDIVHEIRGYPEIENLYSTTGAWDLVINIRCKNLSEMDRALERLRAIPGVRDTQTSLLFASLRTI